MKLCFRIQAVIFARADFTTAPFPHSMLVMLEQYVQINLAIAPSKRLWNCCFFLH
jgi:hypothetical protein